ncbi:hypothetical protein FRC09_004419 [Ceratobasidium sp. 395]|nr:hypothetical protein FRC09_004419 [Ceratobasidium sp. 395]
MSTADFSDPPPPYESADDSGPSDTYESNSEGEPNSDDEVGLSFDSDEFRAMLSRMSSPTLGSEAEDYEAEESDLRDFEIEDFASTMSTTESSTLSEGSPKANVSAGDSSDADDEWAPSDGYESASEAQEGSSLPRKNLDIERVQLRYGHYRKNWMVETDAHDENGGFESDPKGKGKQLECSDIGSPMSLDLVMDTPVAEPHTPGLFYDLSAPGPSFVRWGNNVLYYPPTPGPSRVAAPKLVLRYTPPSSRHHPYQRPRRDRAD